MTKKKKKTSEKNGKKPEGKHPKYKQQRDEKLRQKTFALNGLAEECVCVPWLFVGAANNFTTFKNDFQFHCAADRKL